jgi:hypothetical protein
MFWLYAICIVKLVGVITYLAFIMWCQHRDDKRAAYEEMLKLAMADLMTRSQKALRDIGVAFSKILPSFVEAGERLNELAKLFNSSVPKNLIVTTPGKQDLRGHTPDIIILDDNMQLYSVGPVSNPLPLMTFKEITDDDDIKPNNRRWLMETSYPPPPTVSGPITSLDTDPFRGALSRKELRRKGVIGEWD